MTRLDMGTTVESVTKRFLSIVLALALAFAGWMPCAAQAMSCQIGKRAHDCCDKTSIAANDCCCSHATKRAVSKDTAAPDHDRAKHTLAPVLGGVAIDVAAPLGITAPDFVYRYGPAPPDTLIKQHTCLLV